MAREESRRVGRSLERTLESSIGRIVLRSMQVLPSATPVDTGHARSAWTPSVGAPVTDPLPRDPDRDVAESEARARAAENLDSARRIVRSFRLNQGSAFVSNNAPYIVWLNMGSSPQARPDFIQRGLVEVVRTLGEVPR